ncbi:iron-containing alcohol dehydrogenase [Bordetella avium]|nr:iron-containing alcohol dehydrogenase [Bordetella avium]
MGFPGRYVQGPGALAHLGELLAELGWSRPTVVVDPAVAPLAAVLMADMPRLPFAGECSSETIAALAAAVPPDRDCLLAFGGGKTIDAAKGVARERGLPIVVCPSAASSDAPTSRLIVRYDAEHAVAGVDKLRRNPDAVVVDTDVIVRAVGLPDCLAALGLQRELNEAQWRRLIEATLATDYSRHLVPALTPARLRAALDVAQAWATAEDGCASSAGDNQ